MSEGWWEEWQTSPQGNQELLVVKDKVVRPPDELGVSKSMECDIFPLVLWHCWLGDRKGMRPVKKLDVGLLVVVIWLELCMTYSSSCRVGCTTDHTAWYYCCCWCKYCVVCTLSMVWTVIKVAAKSAHVDLKNKLISQHNTWQPCLLWWLLTSCNAVEWPFT